MIFIYITLLICSFFITYIKYHSLLKINFIYTLMWCLGAILVTINYCGLYSISNKTHLCIIMGIVIFNLVYLIKDIKFVHGFITEWEISKLSYQLIILLNLCSIIFMLPITIKAIKIIIGSGWFALRYFAYGASDMASGSQIMIYSWIINPIFSATFILTSILFFSKSRYTKVMVIISIIDLIFITLTFGGRYNIVKIVLFIISAYGLKQNFECRKSKIPLKYVVLTFLICLLLIYLTSLRSLKGLSAIQNIFVYLFGSLVYFDLITADSFSPLNTIKLYGNATFGILTSIPMYIIYQFTRNNFTPEYLIDQISNDFLYISSSFRYNAFTTWLYPFWKDFRIIGIVIGISFIVILFIFLKKRTIRKHSMCSYAFLIYVCYTILTSTLTYNMVTIQHTMTLIIVYCLTRKSEWIGNRRLNDRKIVLKIDEREI